MTGPRRWVEDPDAAPELRDVLQRAPSARPLDAATRRRLGVKVARASALPVAAAGWLFVKSATAALGAVLGAGMLAVSTGVIDWAPPPAVSAAPTKVEPVAPPRRSAKAVAPPEAPPSAEAAAPPDELDPTPPTPADSTTSQRLSDEAALLETARAKLQNAPAAALAMAHQHAARFPRGQLGSERALIQVDALHRLGRDQEARAVARELLGRSGAGLYAERVRQLLGEDVAP